ncbi:gamma-glutamyl-gamma-aminobutyrate hydrolase family protein [Dietzia lutea]|uniref:gamma-glutamyl-gamma-aminobutyrate hydrolase family protein n=1 Tax=Dietzia lutea TaxID=546160 RepID=UPI000D557C23|nr:gamma-glutamyl-gamma-aminobutyrate hydrolase family protein [Dietzia lutea]
MKARPLIGITGRKLSASVIRDMDLRYSSVEIDIVFNDYAECVAAAGGIPIYLPYQAEAEMVADRLDGVLITGGQDVHPSCWGRPDYAEDRLAPNTEAANSYDLNRDRSEIALARTAVDRSIPLLGVCRGAQVLNVSRGGTLISDLPAGEIEHYAAAAAPSAGAPNHVIDLFENTLARRLFGEQLVRNSWHHQSVDTPGRDLVVSGRTADGVAETIEIPDHPVLGVQWHPEWQTDPDPSIDWLVAAARDRMHRRDNHALSTTGSTTGTHRS